MLKLYEVGEKWIDSEFKYKQNCFRIIEAYNCGFLCLQLTGKKKNYVLPLEYKDFIYGVKTDIIKIYQLGGAG